MFDFSAMYDEVYGVIGVPATLTAGTAGEITLTVIDKTRSRMQTSGTVETSSVGPSAHVRMPELTEKGITADDWDGALLAFNGRTWIVRKGDVLGSPNGEGLGEVRLLLKDATLG